VDVSSLSIRMALQSHSNAVLSELYYTDMDIQFIGEKSAILSWHITKYTIVVYFVICQLNIPDFSCISIFVYNITINFLCIINHHF